jgi:hypothetical protein
LPIEKELAKERQEATQLINKGIQRQDVMVPQLIVEPLKGEAIHLAAEQAGIS